jgi:hypothetical protein
MVVGFTTTYAISDYNHWCCELESRSGRGVQHYMIKFVSDLLQVGGFLRVLRFPPPIKLTATIWLKYYWKWLSTPSNKQTNLKFCLYRILVCSGFRLDRVHCTYIFFTSTWRNSDHRKVTYPGLVSLAIFNLKSIEFWSGGFHLRTSWHLPAQYG